MNILNCIEYYNGEYCKILMKDRKKHLCTQEINIVWMLIFLNVHINLMQSKSKLQKHSFVTFK